MNEKMDITLTEFKNEHQTLTKDVPRVKEEQVTYVTKYIYGPRRGRTIDVRGRHCTAFRKSAAVPFVVYTPVPRNSLCTNKIYIFLKQKNVTLYATTKIIKKIIYILHNILISIKLHQAIRYRYDKVSANICCNSCR